MDYEIWLEDLRDGDFKDRDFKENGVEILANLSSDKSKINFEYILETENDDLDNEQKRIRYFDFHYQDLLKLDQIREIFESVGFSERRNKKEEANILLDYFLEFNKTVQYINDVSFDYGQIEPLVKEINIDLYYTQFERNINYRGFEPYEQNEYDTDKINKASIDFFINDISKMNEKELDKTLDFDQVYYQISLVIPEKIETSDLKILVEMDTKLVNKFGLDNFSLSMIDERERFIEKVQSGHWAAKGAFQ